MSQQRSPHGVLSNLAEHKRDKEAIALQHLNHYRNTLNVNIKQSSVQAFVLQQQMDLKIKRGMQASELMLLQQSLTEHELYVADVKAELKLLDIAIKQQKKKWGSAHKKFKAHEKLHQQLQRKENMMLGHKLQATQDDQFSASMLRNQKASI